MFRRTRGFVAVGLSRFHGREAGRKMTVFPWNRQFSVKFRGILQIFVYLYILSIFFQYLHIYELISMFNYFSSIIRNIRH